MTKGRGLGLWLIFLEVEILATEKSCARTQEEPLNKLREDLVTLSRESLTLALPKEPGGL